jgi:glycosyltransferase involved in cell wall biosynthesis
MNIAIVTGILQSSFGGPPEVIRAHLKSLRGRARTSLFGVCPKSNEDDVRHMFPQVQCFPPGWPARWFRGQGLTKHLVTVGERFDVFHAHMVWDHTVWAASIAARKHRRPLVITPHGSLLVPWRYRALYKRAYRSLILERILRDAACFHALNQFEADAARSFGVQCPIRVIPNGIDVAMYEASADPGLLFRTLPLLKTRRTLLYLGRLCREKGLDLLVEAWAHTRTTPIGREWVLVMAGPDYRGYRQILERRIVELGISDSVLLPGPVKGNQKRALIRAAECFILPSLGEAFSIALLEAAAAGVPSIYTHACNFPDIASQNGGWAIDPYPDAISAVLRQVLTSSVEELRKVGANARAVVKGRYTLDHVGVALEQLYRDLMAAA